jgi:hypothetical protein
MNNVSISYMINVGAPGIDNDPKNPIARALDDLLLNGNPTQKFLNCLFSVNVNGQLHSFRWLGVFAHTSGERVLFFPGYFLSLLEYGRGRVKQPVKPFEIDHVTLERDLRRWHVTGRNQKRQGGMTTRDIGEDRFLWFGMSVANPEVLRPLMRETTIQGSVPATDTDRRMGCFQDATRNVQDILLTTPEMPKWPDSSFLHFSVIAGRNDFADYRDQGHALPESSPLAEILPPIGSRFEVRTHRAKLGDDLHLQLSCFFMQGRLIQPVVFAW